MGRLTLLKFYCCGPIDRVENMGADWRDDMSEWLLSKNAIPLNPLQKPIDIGLEGDLQTEARHELKKQKKFDELRAQMKLIRAIDLRMVDECNCVIANMDLTHNPCGTWEEIFMANRQKKPIIIHAANGIENLPDWIFGAIPHQMFFETWDEVKEYLSHVNNDEHVEDYNRWRFFKYEEVTRKIMENLKASQNKL